MIKISNAELEVMKVVWKTNSTTSMEIIQQLQQMNWSNNTIRTLINRLVRKKALGISDKVGKTYTYVPLISENQYKTKVAKDFIKNFFNNSVDDFIDFLKTI